MKKAFLTLLFVVISTAVFSQITIEPGVRAGVNFSSFVSSNLDSSNFDSKTDFYIGAFAEANIVGFYALRPELNYSRQGASPIFEGASDLEIQYVSVAIVNKFSPFKKLGLDVHFIVGPAISLKVGDNLDDLDDSFGDLKDFDISIFAGIGYDFPFNLSIEARYSLGLVDVIDTNLSTTFFESLADIFTFTEVVQIGATYKFDF